MERRRRSSTINVRRYSAEACSIGLVIFNVIVALYFSVHPITRLVYGRYPIWYPAISFVFIVIFIFLSYIFHIQRVTYINKILHLCVALVFIETLFATFVIFSFVIKADNLVDSLTRESNNTNFSIVKLLQKQFSCNSTETTLIPYTTKLITRRRVIRTKNTRELLSESCALTIRLYIRDVAIFLSTGYLFSTVLMGTLIFIMLFFYKNIRT